MTTREHLRELIEALPDYTLPEAERLLAALQAEHDHVWQAFQNAPEDDEPLTAEESTALEVARIERERGALIPWEEVEAHLAADR